ncbi:MAG: class I SAM-dependent methyltransferase [Anaerolineales bacterium]|nr:class I SAM-dependent methyltransferase [Anaerolineales bacterium]
MAAELDALLSRSARRDNVYYLSDPAPYEEKEDRYFRVRARESRLYPDEVVRLLPELNPQHVLAREWAARADSLNRLLNYVARLQRRLDLLDLGCGNGWMTRHLAALPNVYAYGLDLNRRELTQAARVFLGQPRLKFIYADVFTAPLPPRSFHLIVLASVVQYFPDLPALIRRLQMLCTPDGEIHVLDSPLYAPGEVATARQRTRDYYAKLRLEVMADNYHHHTFQTLAPFRPDVLYNPRTPLNRLAHWWQTLMMPERPRSPFPWLRIAAAISH